MTDSWTTAVRRADRSATAAGCVLALALAAAAAGPHEPPSAAEADRALVHSLVQRLASPARSERVRAERALLDLGTPILPLLPPPERLASVQARESLIRIRRELENREARESIQPARAARREFDGAATLRAFLLKLSERTGNELDLALPDEIAAAPVSVADLFARTSEDLPPPPDEGAETRTFWALLEACCAERALELSADPVMPRLRVAPRPASRAAPWATTVSGPFRVALTGLQRKPIPDDAEHEQLRITLQLLVEPRLRPLFVQYEARRIALKLNGIPMPTRNPDARYDHPLGEGGRGAEFTLDYVVPRGASLERLSLAGRMELQTAAGVARIRFSDLARSVGATRRRGGVAVTLARIQTEPGPIEPDGTRGPPAYVVRVLVKYDAGGPAFESHRSWVLHNEVYLEPEPRAGQDQRAASAPVAPSGGVEAAPEPNGRVRVEYRFRDLPGRLADCSFVYVAPTLLIDVPVEFHLERRDARLD
jgi:hypothetical protein